MIKIVKAPISKAELRRLCQEYFKTFVKIVVDLEREIMAVGGELHADAEAILIADGSSQKNLWGANFYPFKSPAERYEFTALINISASRENFGMEIQSPVTRAKVMELCERLLLARSETLDQ